MSGSPRTTAKSAKSAMPVAPSPEGSGSHAHIMPERIWVVFARRSYDEPLKQVGTVEAEDRELACVYARSIYDEFAWVEMAVAPREALVTVIAS